MTTDGTVTQSGESAPALADLPLPAKTWDDPEVCRSCSGRGVHYSWVMTGIVVRCSRCHGRGVGGPACGRAMASATGGAIVCGSTDCPTCGRPTSALIGPCDGCDESFKRTGKFLRRKAARNGGPT